MGAFDRLIVPDPNRLHPSESAIYSLDHGFGGIQSGMVDGSRTEGCTLQDEGPRQPHDGVAVSELASILLLRSRS